MKTNCIDAIPTSAPVLAPRNRRRRIVLTLALASIATGCLAPPATAATGQIEKVSDVAIAPGRFVNVYQSETGGTVAARLDAYENFSRRLVFRVLENSGERLKVQLPIRPNGVVGYIDKEGVTMKKRDYFLVVDLSDHLLSVYKGGELQYTSTVAVGTKSTPTPTGDFYLTELAKVKNKGSEYGPWAFGLSAFSDKITRFKGRGGQIGLHGTNKPKDLGKNVSHGCIRVSNAAITKLAADVPQGSPISIQQ